MGGTLGLSVHHMAFSLNETDYHRQLLWVVEWVEGVQGYKTYFLYKKLIEQFRPNSLNFWEFKG